MQFLEIQNELVALDTIQNIRNREQFVEIASTRGVYYAQMKFEDLVKALGDKVIKVVSTKEG